MLLKIAKRCFVCLNIKNDNVSASGTIKLFTEIPPCSSCSSAIAHFIEKYPNIIIEVIENGSIRLCCLPRKIQKIDKQNPKCQRPVKTVENPRNFVQIKQSAKNSNPANYFCILILILSISEMLAINSAFVGFFVLVKTVLPRY